MCLGKLTRPAQKKSRRSWFFRLYHFASTSSFSPFSLFFSFLFFPFNIEAFRFPASLHPSLPHLRQPCFKSESFNPPFPALLSAQHIRPRLRILSPVLRSRPLSFSFCSLVHPEHFFYCCSIPLCLFALLSPRVQRESKKKNKKTKKHHRSTLK